MKTMSNEPSDLNLTEDQKEKVHAVWHEIEQEAKECQRVWGMGFPVISLVLLGPKFRKLVKILTEDSQTDE